jgi:hypothetical protein
MKEKPSALLYTPADLPSFFTLYSFVVAARKFLAPGHSKASVHAWFPIQLRMLKFHMMTLLANVICVSSVDKN